MSKLDSALLTFRELEKRADTNNSVVMGVIYENQALVYQEFSDYPKALEFYYKAIKSFKKANDIKRIYGVSYNMGSIYVKQKEYDKALDHYRTLLSNAEEKKDSSQFSQFYKVLGNIHFQLGEYDKAEPYYIKSLELDKKSNIKSNYAISIGNLANLYQAQNKFDKSYNYYLEALKLENEIGNQDAIARNFANLGELFFKKYKLNNNNSDLDSAKKHLLKAISIYDISGEKQIKSETIKILSEVYAYAKYFDKAFKYSNKYISLMDSLLVIQSKNSMRSLEFKRDEKIREQEIALLKAENKYTNNVVIFLVTLSVLILIIFSIALWLYRTKQQQNQQLEIGIKQRTAELEKARSGLKESLLKEKELSEMKSNFIMTVSHEFKTPFTALLNSTAILEKLADNNSDISKVSSLVKKSVNKLNELLENVLGFSDTERESRHTKNETIDLRELTDELIFWSKNIDQNSHKISYDIQIENEKITSDPNLIKKSFKQVLKNSILYSNPNSEIKVTYKEDANNWYFEFQDEGPGISEQEIKNIFEPFYKGRKDIGLKSGAGLGLSIAKKYFEILNGTVNIESTLNQGTKVIFKLIK